MTELEAAWLAGIVEGEGSMAIRVRGPRGRKEISLNICMTDRDIIERCARIMDAPMISLKMRGTQTKQPYRVSLTKWEGLETTLRAIRPWLGERRGAKADELLMVCEEHTDWVESGGRKKLYMENWQSKKELAHTS